MKKGVIIGAGIGGLTTAIALLKKGIDVTIYEQAEALNEVGAGIWVAPNGLKVFAELGIAEDIIKGGKILDKISIVDVNYKPVSIIDGNKIKSKHGFATVALHRATLQKILASHIPSEKIVLNKKLKSYQQSDSSISAEFEDGTTANGDFLIDAGGIKSNARAQMQKELNLRYSGQTCWRFVADFDLAKEEEGNMYEIWSKKKGLRIGYSKINDRQIYVFITNYEKAGGKDDMQSLKNDLVNLCSDFPPLAKEMILSADEKSIIRSDLFDFKPLKSWTVGRMALMGDAAHATTPNLGQGACQAIEDAYVIANQLSLNNDVIAGLKAFEGKRIKKANFITNTSYQIAQMTNTSGLIKSFFMALMRMTPNMVNEKQIDKIYSLDY